MSKRGIALTLICSVALLAACTDQPTAVDKAQVPQFNVENGGWVPVETWPLDPWAAYVPCANDRDGEIVDQIVGSEYTVWAKVTEAGKSGNVNKNRKVTFSEGSGYIGRETGDVWILTKMNETWNAKLLDDGSEKTWASLVERYENQDGERLTMHSAIELVFPPGGGFPTFFREKVFKCNPGGGDVILIF